MAQVLGNGASLRRRLREYSLKLLGDICLCWRFGMSCIWTGVFFAYLHELVIDSGIDTRT
jgi:hypothetical protein